MRKPACSNLPAIPAALTLSKVTLSFKLEKLVRAKERTNQIKANNPLRLLFKIMTSPLTPAAYRLSLPGIRRQNFSGAFPKIAGLISNYIYMAYKNNVLTFIIHSTKIKLKF